MMSSTYFEPEVLSSGRRSLRTVMV